MSIPSIKGSVFEGLMADLRETVAAGRGDLDELRDALEDKHRDLLEGDVASIQWVPIGAYAAILDYLTRVEGAADPVAYLRRRGANACDRLIGGIYKAFKVEPGNWGARTGEIMMGMGKLLYNFTRWSFSDVGSGVYQISCEEASDFPGCAVETAHGFIERYASKASGRAVKVESSRPTRARIVFTVRAQD